MGVPPSHIAAPPSARRVVGEPEAKVSECERAQGDAEPHETVREERSVQPDQERLLLDGRPRLGQLAQHDEPERVQPFRQLPLP